MNKSLLSRLKNTGGFTFLELLTVLALMSLMAYAAQIAYVDLMPRARDGRRLLDAGAVRDALENYHTEKAVYPPIPVGGGPYMGWTTSYAPNFLSGVYPTYLDHQPADPTNTPPVNSPPSGLDRDGKFYAYYHYNTASSLLYGCGGGTFAVLTVKQLETPHPNTQPEKAYCGPPGFDCPGTGVPNVCRDWSHEFDVSYWLGD